MSLIINFVSVSTVLACLRNAFFSGVRSQTGSSADKEFTCNTGDTGSTSGLGRSPGEAEGYPLQYYWASLVVHLVNNLPAMRETCSFPVLRRSPGGGNGYPLKYSGLENHHSQRSLVGYSPQGQKETDMTEYAHTCTYRDPRGTMVKNLVGNAEDAGDIQTRLGD